MREAVSPARRVSRVARARPWSPGCVVLRAASGGRPCRLRDTHREMREESTAPDPVELTRALSEALSVDATTAPYGEDSWTSDRRRPCALELVENDDRSAVSLVRRCGSMWSARSEVVRNEVRKPARALRADRRPGTPPA